MRERALHAAAAFAQAAVGIGFLLIVTLWSFVYFHGQEQHRLARTGAERELGNLARAFAEHVSRSVKEIDASLLLLRRAMLTQGADFKLADYTNSNYFKNDLLLQIASVDRDGFVVDSNLGSPAQSMNVNDRAHIRVHRERPDEDLLYVSAPVVGRISGRWSIQFTRKIVDVQGAYSGVLVASVNPEFLSDYYSTFDIADGVITLVGRDGIVRARGNSQGGESVGDQSGPVDQARDQIGDHIGMRAEYMQSVRTAAARSGCFTAVSQLNGVEKMFCARAVPVAGVDQDVVVSAPLERIDADVLAVRNQLTLLALLVTVCCFALMGAAVVRRYKLFRAVRELEIARGEAASLARDLRYALENISDGVMLFDGEGEILISNEQAFAYLGLDPAIASRSCNNAQATAGVRALSIPACEDLADLADLAGAMRLAHGSHLALCAGPGGKVLELRTQSLDDGGYVRTIADVTQTYNDGRTVAKARDDAQAATRARSSFLARMSHEIRTPLHSALGFTQLLAQEVLSPGAAEIAGNIHASTSHLIAIVDDILDFSTIEAGRLRMNAGPVDVPGLTARLEVIAKPLLAGKDVTLDVSLAPQTPRFVMTDERRLLQILTNLLSNAIKFTDAGFVRVLVSPLAGAFGEARLRFEVADSGCGLPLETAAQLFEPFSRGQGAEARPGSGLGLAIVKELVTLIGGHIEVDSAPGKGARFILDIPAVQAQEESGQSPQEPPIRKLNVLVADDTRSSLSLIRLLLEKRGHRVVTVGDGKAATQASMSERFDLVLLDIQMPLMSGFEAAAFIRRQFQGSGERPLISALTAQVLPEDQLQARASGMDHILRKPFEARELDALLRAAAAGVFGEADPERISA